LIRSDLLDAVTAVQLSKSTIKNIKQNLFWAFIYNIIGIPLAAGVFYVILNWKLNPMFAAGAMSLSSVSVVSNALRLKFFKPVRITEVVAEGTKEINETNETKDQKVESVINSDITNKSNNNGGNKMNKVLTVEGMSCGHCKAAVEKALKNVDGVDNAVVDLGNKTAEVTLSKEVSTEDLKNAVTEAGYEVTEVK
jgi:Cu+-exporting ATPase